MKDLHGYGVRRLAGFRQVCGHRCRHDRDGRDLVCQFAADAIREESAVRNAGSVYSSGINAQIFRQVVDQRGNEGNVIHSIASTT